MLQSLILFLLFIGIFRFVMRFVLPVARVGSAVHRQMKHMQQTANHAAAQDAPKKQSARKAAPDEEYIDYEEVR